MYLAQSPHQGWLNVSIVPASPSWRVVHFASFISVFLKVVLNTYFPWFESFAFSVRAQTPLAQSQLCCTISPYVSPAHAMSNLISYILLIRSVYTSESYVKNTVPSIIPAPKAGVFAVCSSAVFLADTQPGMRQCNSQPLWPLVL